MPWLKKKKTQSLWKSLHTKMSHHTAHKTSNREKFKSLTGQKQVAQHHCQAPLQNCVSSSAALWTLSELTRGAHVWVCVCYNVVPLLLELTLHYANTEVMDQWTLLLWMNSLNTGFYWQKLLQLSSYPWGTWGTEQQNIFQVPTSQKGCCWNSNPSSFPAALTLPPITQPSSLLMASTRIESQWIKEPKEVDENVKVTYKKLYQ